MGKARACAVVTGVIIVVVAAFLIGFSIRQVDPNEVALEWDSINMRLNTDQVYTAGTYFIGVGHFFIPYPQALQTIKYAANNAADDGDPIDCRTQDGLPVYVSFAVNYKLRTTAPELVQRYIDFGEISEVNTAYNRIARNVVRSVSSNYPAIAFFSDRQVIEAALQRAMADELSSMGAVVESTQLLDFTFPAAFNEARVRQQAASQQQLTAQNELSVAAINAQTRVEAARGVAALLVSSAAAKAASAKLANAAAIQGLQARYAAEAEAYAEVAIRLGLNSTQLLAYVWLDAFSEGTAAAAQRGDHIAMGLRRPQALTLPGFT